MYGDSVDKIVSSNTAVFIYLISNDTDMLEELSKQAGSTHVARKSSKSVSRSVGALKDTTSDDVSYQISVSEERLLPVDKLMSFANGESLTLSTVHRADNTGEAYRPTPIYNTKSTLLPMAWALHLKGHNNSMFKDSLQGVELAVSSSDQDVYKMIPDFQKMYEKQLKKVRLAQKAKEQFMIDNGLEERDLFYMDVDETAESIMRMVNVLYYEAEQKDKVSEIPTYGDEDDLHSSLPMEDIDGDTEGVEVLPVELGESSENNRLYDTLSAEERQTSDNVKNLDTFDIEDSVKDENHRVAKEDQEFVSVVKDNEINRTRFEAQKLDKIYVDNSFSYNMLKDGVVKEALQEAFKEHGVKPEDVSGRYRYQSTGDGGGQFVYNPTGVVAVTQIPVNSAGDNVEEPYVVEDVFIEALLREAQPSSIRPGDAVEGNEFRDIAHLLDPMFEFSRDSKEIRNNFIRIMRSKADEYEREAEKRRQNH